MLIWLLLFYNFLILILHRYDANCDFISMHYNSNDLVKMIYVKDRDVHFFFDSL